MGHIPDRNGKTKAKNETYNYENYFQEMGYGFKHISSGTVETIVPLRGRLGWGLANQFRAVNGASIRNHVDRAAKRICNTAHIPFSTMVIHHRAFASSSSCCIAPGFQIRSFHHSLSLLLGGQGGAGRSLQIPAGENQSIPVVHHEPSDLLCHFPWGRVLLLGGELIEHLCKQP